MTDKIWVAAVTLGSSTDGEGKISLALYNKEGKTTHTISQPVIDGDSITTGKDTIINETAYDINGNESAVTDGNGNVTTYTYDDQNRVTGVSRKNGLEQTLKLIGAFSFCGKSKKDDPAVFWLWDF